jgi:hypothetical protein
LLLIQLLVTSQSQLSCKFSEAFVILTRLSRGRSSAFFLGWPFFAQSRELVHDQVSLQASMYPGH